MTSIAGRLAEVATRTVPGHGEGARSNGARNGSAVGTLVARTTRVVILARMGDGREACARRLHHNTPARARAAAEPADR